MRICLFILLSALVPAVVSNAIDIIPPVHEQKMTDGVFRIDATTRIESQGDVANEINFLRETLSDEFGMTLANQGGTPVAGGTVIALAIRPANDETPKDPEGYFLRVTPARIDLNSTTSAGIYYGLTTLRQLMTARNGHVEVPTVTIRDWPDMHWRAAFLCLRFVAAGEAEQKKLHDLVRVFAALKYNKLLIEISDNMVYKNWDWPNRAKPAFNHENLATLIEVARQNHIELIPYLQTVSHTLWVRSNDALWQEIKEGDTVKIWDSQYCPSNPKSNQLVHDVIAEQIEIFKPRFFHIGLDEAWEGPFGTCPVCRQKDHVELYRSTVLDICKQLLDAGVRPIAYQDGFALRTDASADHPPHGWKVIDQMPREMIINAWDYSAELGHAFDEQLKWFSDKGFDVVGASYQRPRNVLDMAPAVMANPRGLGTILTYWYDVESWEKYESVSPVAWATTTLAAMKAWNLQTPEPADLTMDLVAPVRRVIHRRDALAGSATVPIDLSHAYNARFGGEGAAIPDRPMTKALAALAESKAFEVAEDLNIANAIVLSGQTADGLPLAPVTIDINRVVNGLEFLHTCDRPFSDSKWNIDPNGKTLKPTIGRYRIQYTDGTEAIDEIRFNWNIVDWNATVPAFEAAMAYAGKADDGSRVLFVKHCWVNPNPEKPVASVIFETTQTDGMAPVLLGLNALVADMSPVVIDSFNSPGEDISKNWRVLQELFDGPVKAAVLGEAEGRKGVLSLQFPATGVGSSARLMLDKNISVPKGAKQIAFWMWVEDPDRLGQTGVYLGNDNFVKHGALFRAVRLVTGWQQVIVPIDSLTGITTDEATQLRISIWIAERQPATTVLIDDVQWKSTAGRPGDARTTWFDF